MNERISNLMKHPLTLPIGVGLLSLGAGVGLGYILGRRSVGVYLQGSPEQLELDFENLERVIYQDSGGDISVEEHHEVSVQDPQFKERVGRFVAEKLKENILSSHDEEITEEEDEETRSIFAHTDNEWDYEKEVASRTLTTPYVIHRDEFFADEKGYVQSTLTYYEGDNILVDEDDAPIYNHNDIIGELLFGHGSGDPNVVHIRNDKRKAEYEIIRDPGLYTVEVLGLEIEDNERAIKHSAVRRFRME